MLITVTTTNQTLEEILSDIQKNSVKDKQFRHTRRGNSLYNVEIYNNGADDIYFDKHNAASTTTWIPIKSGWGSYSLQDIDLTRLNLISDTNDNADVRVVIS